MMTKPGVVYLFAYSLGYAERTAVSLHTLRKHWAGSVTIFTDDLCYDLARRIGDDRNIDAHVQKMDVVRGLRHSAYITKTLIPTVSPYAESLLIDGDTIVVGPIDDLFRPPLAITQFSDWISTGRTISKRIGWWRGKSPAIDRMVKSQLSKPWPAVNTGVVGWHRGHDALPVWNAVTLAGAGLHMTDELAMQLLTSEMEPSQYRVFDDRWNCSPFYGVNKENAVIWHFHGAKHLRKEAGRALWEPAFWSAYDSNVGGLREWAGKYDSDVGQLLKAKAA